MIFEILPDRIVLPDERLQIDGLLRVIDGREHGIVEIPPVAIELERVLSRGDLRKGRSAESHATVPCACDAPRL